MPKKIIRDMEKAGSGSWKERIEEEFAKISSERSNAEKFWQRIKNLQINMNSKKETDKQATKKSGGILKKIKESVLLAKETADKKNSQSEFLCPISDNSTASLSKFRGQSPRTKVPNSGDKRWKRAEIQREKIALERKKEELRRKKEALAKKRSMLI